jgi:hypothetical protein
MKVYKVELEVKGSKCNALPECKRNVITFYARFQAIVFLCFLPYALQAEDTTFPPHCTNLAVHRRP